MFRVAFSLLAFSVLLTQSVLAEPLSTHDRDFLMSQFHVTRKMFLDTVAGVSPAQWNFKPVPERWSLAEIAEHIALAEDRLFMLVSEKILKEPAEPNRRGEVAGMDEKVLQSVPNRSQKAQAPEMLQPTHRFKDKDAAVAAFLASRDRNIAWVEKRPEGLRDHFAPSPSGLMDAYQWLLLVSAHTERHLKQMNEVKADRGYPGK
jgi:hypothetical protein